MTIRELIQKIKDDTNADLFDVISGIGYTLTLWDSGTGATHTVTTNEIFTESEISALDLFLLIKYGSLNVKPDIVDYLGGEHFISTHLTKLCKAIVGTYKNHWYRLGRDLLIHYNPSWNVDGTTSITETWDDYEHNTHRENTQTKDGESISEQLNKSTSLSKAFGIDSTEGVNDAYNESDAGKVKTTNNAGDSEEDIKETINGAHVTTEVRGGNIGTTMTSQIIRDDLNVYEEYNLIKYIVRDIVDFIGGGFWEC